MRRASNYFLLRGPRTLPSEFDDDLGWNLDLLYPLWVDARARFSLLLHQLAKARQNEFAGLFGCFVS